jgi:hypothetical protein
MSVKTRNFTLFTSALVAVLLLAVTLSTCESTLGFGDAIDFIPPVLEFKPEPTTPMYVRAGTELSGIVTDNLNIDRVIARAAGDNENANIKIGDILFIATLSGSDPKSKTWVIVMDFEEKDNNEKILLEIVAYDKAGNSGEESVLPVTIIVDMQPPVVEDMWLHRTDQKPPANLETYGALVALEETDPDGKEILNVDKYQNGFFTLMGTVAEKETSIEIIALNIYDRMLDNINPLVELEVIVEDAADFSPFSPRWLVSEEALLEAGNARGWANYKNDYYNNDVRYYYRVEIVAIDNSKNESDDGTNMIKQDEGHFVLWANADKPKGIIDLRTDEGKLIGESNVNVQKGTSLPVVFFDDDQLLWAYTGLLTIDQWNGTRTIASGVSIPAGTDAQKLQFLRDRLVAKQPVYNWKYLKTPSIQEPINDQINSRKIFEHTTSVATGNDLTDNGEYRLFTIMADTKLKPHTNNGSVDTDRPRENLTVYKVNVIDENEPLIVFDTTDPEKVGEDHLGGPPHEMIIGAQTGNSPEENTFPKLTDGKTFTINGYTLRPNKEGQNNRVVYFRIAWIPMTLIESESENVIVPKVRRALSATGYPNRGPEGTADPSMADLADDGVKHWNFALNDPTTPHPNNTEYDGTLFTGTRQELEGSDGFLKKQVFKKEFNILEDFKFKDKDEFFENDIKLFIFYAEDDMGHIVFRELRLLGNQTPPEITIYDLTTRDANFSMNYGDANNPQLPNLNHDVKSQSAYYFFNGDGNIDDAGRTKYRKKLLEYQPTGYGILRNIAMPGGTLATSLPGAELNAVYPRETTIKYWVTAKSGGFLEIKNIQMRDVTFAVNAPYNAGSYLGRRYNENSISTPTSEPVYVGDPVAQYKDDLSLSFVEMLPEVTQRVLLFTAKDSLNNTVSIQRTVTVTNAAVLNNITTTTQTGTYGIGTTITLQANFSNLVEWTGTNPPQLNVRYNRGVNNTPTIVQINTKTPKETPTLSLEFDLVVAENDRGIVQTLYSDIPGVTFNPANSNRPITLPANTAILDYERKDNAFTPGNVPGFNWTDAGRGPANSLQGSKQITLDGVRPTISSFLPYIPTGTTKTQYTDANGGYYFKLDETIYFTLTANKDIFTDDNPVIEFQVANGGTWHQAAWLRSSSARAMVFSAQVSSTTVQGSITGIRLANASTIVDGVGNAFAAGLGALTVSHGLTDNNTIRIDRTAPPAPPTTLNNTSTTTAPELYNAAPVLRVTRDVAPTGEITVPAKTEYSLNNGVTWIEFPTATQNHSTPAIAALNWTSAGTATGTLNILNGQWTLKTRFTDRAGNVGFETTKAIHVNAIFPNLIAVTNVSSNGWYIAGANLSFTLDFAEPVRVQTANNVQIVLTNRGSTAVQAGTSDNNMILSAATGQDNINRSGNTTITFNWTNIGAKEMRDGMYISYIRLNGLQDRFGNSGPVINTTAITYTASTTNPSPISGTFANPAIPNLGTEVKVDGIAPAITGRTPAIDGVATTIVSQTNNDFRNRITLTFRENVMKGNGTITIKPKNDFYVPPVFENNGYYLDQFSGTGNDIWARTEVKSATNVAGRTTWVPGFYDVYNSGLTIAQRNYLTESTTVESQSRTVTYNTYTPIPSDDLDTTNPSMSRLRLDRRTGQPVGPYVRTTHGLVEGAGYSGNYAGNATANGPAPAGTFMVPDTATKWVLAYPYSINNTDHVQYANSANTMVTPSNDVVNNIRAALVAAKFRWQEIDVISANVTISGATVTITLTEPLLKGLQWELSYTAGTFTDMAGNNAPALAGNTYTFWSPGAQKPVVRVDRRTYDARTANWQRPRDNNNNTGGFTYANPTVGGWGIAGFETIAYRIETETPGATISYGNYGRAAGLNSTSNTATGAGPFYAVTAGWTGAVARVNQGVTGYQTSDWDHTQTTAGQWVRPNLIRRGGSGTNSYTVNGVTRTFQAYNNNNYNGIRSYNADVAPATLTGLALTSTNTADSKYRNTLGFGALEAGKSYIAATAGITNGGTAYTSNRGYEGVFRTVVALYYSANTTGTGANTIAAEGSNIKNGMPSISGFPVQDAAETGDCRFIKLFYRNTDNRQFYWVSTDIVSEFYFIKFGGGGSHQANGEVNNYLTVGYGDLTYARNLVSY